MPLRMDSMDGNKMRFVFQHGVEGVQVPTSSVTTQASIYREIRLRCQELLCGHAAELTSPPTFIGCYSSILWTIIVPITSDTM
jgi:hypothetical protein